MTKTDDTLIEGKRILITGGAGDMGEYACRVLATADEVDRLLIADRNIERAEKLAAELGTTAQALELDISDADVLSAALADVDIVLNCAGPFYRFGREVLSAAIATNTDYLDICDDWEPTLEMLELDDAARAAGVTAVLGMGASPGTSNLLALLAMNELDEVDRVLTVWRAGGFEVPPEGAPVPEPTAAVQHWIHNCTEQIKIWRDGKLADAYALEELAISYPGIGDGPVWVCGHPEPLTLPRVRPELKDSLNVMTSRRGLMEGLQRVAARVQSGEFGVIDAAKQLVREKNIRGPAAGEPPIHPNLFAIAEGRKDGERTRAAAQPIVLPNANMGEMTGYPLAIAALMLARGQVDQPGVHGPEGAVDPATYFAELAKLVDDPPTGVEPVDVVTERY